MGTDKDYVLVGHVTEGSEEYKMFRDGSEAQSGRLRFGPAVDPETCEVNPRWRGMLGIYVQDTPAGISLCLKDREGRKITLERVMEKARLLPLAVRGEEYKEFWIQGGKDNDTRRR